ncbi:MAG: MATE family efflux transporter [Ruminococcaceae bacterium]|nr:MATE family efflux transporter [Oscillospiraceae bacterium]
MIKKFFFDSAFWKVTLRLALPIAIQNMLTSSYVLVDTLMVGQLGDVALSSVGMAGQLNWLMNMLIFGVCSAASVFFAQYWGVDDNKGIRKIYGISLNTSIIVSLLFLLLGFFATAPVIRIFNQDISVIATGSAYLKIACFSYPAAAINMLFCTLLRSTEEVKLPMYVSVFTTLMNAIMDYALIFGAFGLPKMGIEGAALATVISAWSGPILLFIVSFFRKNMLVAPLKELLGFSISDIKEFFLRATPVILNEGMWGLGTILYNIIFSNMGYEYFAAVTILRTFENIAFVFFVGLCNACSVMIGKSIGAGKIRRGVSDARRFCVIIPVISFVLGMVIVLFREQLVGIFNLNDNITQKTIEAATMILVLYGCHIAVRNIPYVTIVGIFRSGGDTSKGVKYDLICLWLISLPVTFFGAYFLELPFVVVYALMYICEDYIKSYLCLRHLKSLNWIKPVTIEGTEGIALYRKQKHRFFETE